MIPDFKAYIKIEQLPDELKAKHKIKIGAKTPRFDVTGVSGYYPELESIKNPKGQIYFNLLVNDGFIDTNALRRADRRLQAKDSLNFSSVYLLNLNTEPMVGYGNPNGQKTYSKDKKPNPFYECRTDGYLFIIQPDWKAIEILVITNGLYTIEANAKAFADGQYNEALATLRATAKPIFEY